MHTAADNPQDLHQSKWSLSNFTDLLTGKSGSSLTKKGSKSPKDKIVHELQNKAKVSKLQNKSISYTHRHTLVKTT